jgi:hypothetical protein
MFKNKYKHEKLYQPKKRYLANIIALVFFVFDTTLCIAQTAPDLGTVSLCTFLRS